MKRRIIISLALCGLLMSIFGAAHADLPDPRLNDAANALNRIPPGAPGEQRHVTLLYGPYVVPPGQDNNKITLDVPVQTGFYTKVYPNLVDVKTGKEPTEQEAHIHHAHWFRVTSGGNYEYYQPINGAQGLSWVFGTGEERTGGTLRDRESPVEGWQYGIFLDGNTPQALIFMIHNKTNAPLSAYITLNIDMVYGTREQIKEATGRDIHPLRGVLTGTTENVLANRVLNGNSKNGVLIKDYTADFSGTLVASASHMHPGGKWVYVTNLGPMINGRPACADVSVNVPGIPGTVLFISKKFDHNAATWPYSEDYQMGATQGGYRAPIHQGDIIRQYGVYDMQRATPDSVPQAVLRSDPMNTSSPIDLGSVDGRQHGWYAAMSYTGLYADPDNQPTFADGITSPSQCTAANFAPTLVPTAGFNATTHETLPGDTSWSNNPLETHITHPWLHIDPVCGTYDESPTHQGTFACDSTGQGGTRVVDPITYVDGQLTDTIRAAGFDYLPGDLALRNLDGTLPVPLVKAGSTLHLVNADLAIGVRHTFTTCALPCDGPYMANYPTPDGIFDSGKLGNLDYIDGGITGTDTIPLRDIKIDSTFATGSMYSYFCSIHPWMRGVFKVVA